MNITYADYNHIYDDFIEEWNLRTAEDNEAFGFDPDSGIIKNPDALRIYRAKLTGQMETRNGIAWTANISGGGPMLYVEQQGNGGPAHFDCLEHTPIADFRQAAKTAFDDDSEHMEIADLAAIFLIELEERCKEFATTN